MEAPSSGILILDGHRTVIPVSGNTPRAVYPFPADVAQFS
jgi:hypothetical protein